MCTLAFELIGVISGIKLFSAGWDDVFWSTFNDNADDSISPWEAVGHSHLLTFRAEWNHSLKFEIALTFDKLILNWDFIFDEELEKTNFNWTSSGNVLAFVIIHFHVGIAVKENAVLEGLVQLVVQLKVGGVLH